MKKSNILLLTALIIVLAGITALAIHFRLALRDSYIEGDRNIQQEVRDIQSYSKINIKGNVKAILDTDMVNDLTVEADSNLLEHIVAEVVDGELKIYFDRIVIARDIKVYISNHYLEGINLSGGSHFISEKPVEFDDIHLKANGGARITIDGRFNNTFIELNAGSNAHLTGNCNELRVIANAGSNLKAKDLLASDVDITATAGSNLEVNVSDRLSVNASSGSNIYYHGDPEMGSIQTSSGANLRKK